MSAYRYVRVPRPVEDAAIRAVSSAARPAPPVEALLWALLVAHKVRDRHGFVLAAHRAARAVLGDEGVTR
ncbi:hypothetical protein [Streptomyces synnematoformans]|uniref:Uncharacterized protein n=1 Tax=Streptomyces synnematoformans TaxID=415721 RepID=A0ABP5JKI2_9ACTN